MSKNMTREELLKYILSDLPQFVHDDIKAETTENLRLIYNDLKHGEQMIAKFGSSMVADWADVSDEFERRSR
ncbi:MAG: hypothetical protein LBR29_04860 [Methylobacteriaceae bacterium]|nr:hypothetical protein [Methylobacteriaceae bacterium]